MHKEYVDDNTPVTAAGERGRAFLKAALNAINSSTKTRVLLATGHYNMLLWLAPKMISDLGLKTPRELSSRELAVAKAHCKLSRKTAWVSKAVIRLQSPAMAPAVEAEMDKIFAKVEKTLARAHLRVVA